VNPANTELSRDLTANMSATDGSFVGSKSCWRRKGQKWKGDNLVS